MKRYQGSTKLLHVMIHLGGNEGGGVCTMVEAWHKGFTERGVRVSYLANRNGEYVTRLREGGRELHCVGMGETRSRSWKLGRFRMPDVSGWFRTLRARNAASKKFEAVLNRENPDVVLGNGPNSTAVIGPACRTSGVDLVTCFHGISDPNDFLQFRKRIIAYLVNRYCREIVGVSDTTLNFKRFTKVPFRVIHNTTAAVLTSHGARAEFRKQWGIGNDTVVFGSASRISPSKAIHRFVDAASLFSFQNPSANVVFVIAGKARSRDERAYLEKIIGDIRQAGLEDKIRYVGQQPIDGFYSAIDVFCHTHQGVEPLGLTVIEAISAGLPVIICNRGGFLEVLPEDVGYRYDSLSHRDLAEAMHWFLDPSHREEQSRKGRNFFTNDYLSFSQWVDDWLETLFGDQPERLGTRPLLQETDPASETTGSS